MAFIADLHIHSKYSRATAHDMDLENLARWAKIKGVSMLGTGDFTHPDWMGELKGKLEETGRGVYGYDGISFILTAEVSNIYYKAGRARRVHTIICSPGLKIVDEINAALSEYGDLASDGRPLLHLECDKMVKIVSAIDPDVIVIPAHAWTPHFGIFGSKSGFDSPEECFEDQIDKVYSIETGLSSDPAMNWRWSRLDRFCLTSHSDAHSPSKIGREANVFSGKIDYPDLVGILRAKDASRFLYTIEFFPEEGKYHWDGHRSCKVRLSPEDAMRTNNLCPVCGKKVTVGVMHRLTGLADRQAGYVDRKSPSYKSIVPLAEIIGDALGVSADAKSVEKEYFKLIKALGTEFSLLLETPEGVLKEKCPAMIASGIINVREGNLGITPGYDGEYGKVSVFKSDAGPREKQMSFL